MHTDATLRGVSEPPSRPIFIIGSFRSGTSMLFSLLQQHRALRSLPGEGYVLWDAYQHPRRKRWSSDQSTERDTRPGERRFLYTAIHRVAGDHRFLDKTPRNVLRIPYLATLFPDATFVLIRRDGRDTVSSLIEGWEQRFGGTYSLPEPLELADYRGRLWRYLLPPGWRDWTRTSIAEVAGFQYASSYEIALTDRERLSPDSFVDVRYEDMVRQPVKETARLLDRLELASSQDVNERAANLSDYPVHSVTPPRPGKWRNREGEIARIIPYIAPTTTRLGYDSHEPR